MIDAMYECVRCKMRWTTHPTQNFGACPACGHIYYVWKNYTELRRV